MNFFTIAAKRASLAAAIKLTAVFFFFFSISTIAQETPVSGTVTGENNTPLAGVSVTVQGTTRGTSTNSSGRFTISASPNATLVFSSIGYGNQEVNVAGKTEVTVALAASNRELEQVVVVGYGTQRKRDLTGLLLL